MNTLKFKTNIKCDGCIAKVGPALNQAMFIKNWEVDTTHPSKILTVAMEEGTSDEVLEVLKSAGFEAEVISINI